MLTGAASRVLTMKRCTVGSEDRPERFTSPAKAGVANSREVRAEAPSTTSHGRWRDPRCDISDIRTSFRLSSRLMAVFRAAPVRSKPEPGVRCEPGRMACCRPFIDASSVQARMEQGVTEIRCTKRRNAMNVDVIKRTAPHFCCDAAWKDARLGKSGADFWLPRDTRDKKRRQWIQTTEVACMAAPYIGTDTECPGSGLPGRRDAEAGRRHIARPGAPARTSPAMVDAVGPCAKWHEVHSPGQPTAAPALGARLSPAAPASRGGRPRGRTGCR
ncbi:hypothetical protein NB689_001772 [Xanthomonas sacchari]|nr:hypothetical protein [Xanthomonas sacchari]